jgi:predicted nucleic acid-binding protein
MIVLDTTVLAYAVGADHPLRNQCQRLVRAIADGEIPATTTVEVIQEFTHVRARRRDRKDAADLARDYIELLSPLLVVEGPDLREGLRLFQESTGLGAFDAVLAAAAHAAGAEALVSADTAFSALATVRHIVPDADGLRYLLEPCEDLPGRGVRSCGGRLMRPVCARTSRRIRAESPLPWATGPV